MSGGSESARTPVWRGAAIIVILSVASLVACAPSSTRTEAVRKSSPTTALPTTTTTVAPTTTASTTTTVAPVTVSARERLAVLVIDDRPSPRGVYRREEWSHWDDIDGNGCDARQDALIRSSLEPAVVDRSRGCSTVTGVWISPYDSFASRAPGDFDVDHLVPLANAFEAGGWAWDAGRRRQFANDQVGLVVVSASSNRSKGADTPDQWRPSNRASWCAFADTWVRVKEKWGLTVTTRERDALGQMLDTCGPDGPVWPTAAAIPPPLPPLPPLPPPAGGDGGVWYANCTAARAAGAAPIRAGQPGYRAALDRDGDGVACE